MLSIVPPTAQQQQQQAMARGAGGFLMKRGPSVYSLSQLAGTSETSLVSLPESGPAAFFGPTSCVADLPGRPLPTFAFAGAGAGAPQRRRYTRINSSDALAIVPDMDVDSSPASPSAHLPLALDNAWASAYDTFLSASKPPCSTTTLPSAATAAATAPLEVAWALPAAAPAEPSTPSTPSTPSRDSTLLETVVTALWDDCAEQQLFRYDLAACLTKRVPGDLRFVAQLNEGRATKKRPTEFKMDQVVQPFDASKFNFQKAYVREVLFQFEPHTFESAQACGGESTLSESTLCGPSANLVIINVSPIEYGHVLLVPRIGECLPQLVDPHTTELALHFCKELHSPSWRVGYNSLGAYATINHLHFQAYQLDAPFPCELCPTTPLALPGHPPCAWGAVTLGRIANYPVNGWVLRLDDDAERMQEDGASAEAVAQLAAIVGRACMRMAARNVPHNLLISDSGRRVFVWPQCFGERQAAGLIPEHVLDMGVNPAAFEISGHVLLKRQADYDGISEAAVCEMLSYASLPEERFLELTAVCFAP